MIGLWDLQQFHSSFEQAIPVGGAVAVAGDLLQDMPHAGLGADQGVVGDAQALGDGIGGLEPDAVDVQRQAVGVLPHPLDRLRRRRSCRCAPRGRCRRHGTAGTP